MTFRTASISLSLAAACALSACTSGRLPGSPRPPVTQTPQPSPQPVQPLAATCMAAPAQFAAGKTADASLVEDARQKSGARLARVLHPGQVVTMEFLSDRLNLAVDAKGKVIRVTCG